MSDPVDLIGPVVGGMGTGGLMVGLLKFFGSRQVSQLDDTIKTLTGAVRDLNTEVRQLREAHVGMSKDIGALQEAMKNTAARIDGQAGAYRERFDSLQQQINEMSRARPKR